MELTLSYLNKFNIFSASTCLKSLPITTDSTLFEKQYFQFYWIKWSHDRQYVYHTWAINKISEPDKMFVLFYISFESESFCFIHASLCNEMFHENSMNILKLASFLKKISLLIWSVSRLDFSWSRSLSYYWQHHDKLGKITSNSI